MAFPGSARADASSALAELVWERGIGASECLDAADLTARVEARLQREVFVEEGADLRVVGRIEARPAGGFLVRLVLELDGAEIGTREITSDRSECHRLDESLAVVLALFVDVSRDDIALALPNEPSQAAVDAPSASPRTEGDSGWEGGARIEASVGAGTLPDAAWGLRLLAWLRPRGPLSIEVDAGHTLDSSRSLGASTPARVTASVRWLGAAGCLDASLIEWLELGGCVRAELGTIAARGSGFDRPSAGEIPWIAGVVGTRLRARVAGPLEVTIGVELVIPFVRDHFVAEVEAGTRVIAHAPDPVGIRAGIGIGFGVP